MKDTAVRRQIINTAADLFYRQGYNSTGINQIIEEAGVAKTSLYQHFRSKEDLLVEYLRVTADITNEGLNKAIARHSDPEKKISAVFDFLIQFSKQTQCGGCNFLNISAEIPKENSRIRKIIKQQKDQVRQLFRTILAPIGKEDLADDMYLLFDGALVSGKVQGDAWPVVRAKKMAVKMI